MDPLPQPPVAGRGFDIEGQWGGAVSIRGCEPFSPIVLTVFLVRRGCEPHRLPWEYDPGQSSWQRKPVEVIMMTPTTGMHKRFVIVNSTG